MIFGFSSSNHSKTPSTGYKNSSLLKITIYKLRIFWVRIVV
ncbi:hypothetical protein ACWIUD_09415 [Helicobacter sp. 23-1044]